MASLEQRLAKIKPSREAIPGFGGGYFDLQALERVSCAMIENGIALPDEIMEACSKCFPEDEKPCRKERAAIEEAYPLLLGGLAAVTLLIPIARAARTVRSAALFVQTQIVKFFQGIPWLARFVAAPTAEAAGFEAAAASLAPSYVAAVAKTADILAKLEKTTKVGSTPIVTLLILAGVLRSEGGPIPDDVIEDS